MISTCLLGPVFLGEEDSDLTAYITLVQNVLWKDAGDSELSIWDGEVQLSIPKGPSESCTVQVRSAVPIYLTLENCFQVGDGQQGQLAVHHGTSAGPP